MPDDAVVALADDELEGALLSRVAAARAPASRARWKLDATSRDEGAEPQDLFVSQSAMGLPAAGRAHARDERSDRIGEGHEDTFRLTWTYAEMLFTDEGATLDDLREAVETLEDAGRIARRVLGGAHPVAANIELHLRDARAILRARETPSPGDA